MTTPIQPEHFAQALYALLDETFDKVHGIYLDKGTSLFETLAPITAAEASIPVGDKCATLAAQVKHIAFYLDVIDKTVRDPSHPQVDWGEIWRETSTVRAEEWEQIQMNLRQSYDRLKLLINETAEWPSERHIGGAIGAIAHTAYHLGEIRQALCTLKK
jgi:hypothetical protein